MNSSLALSLVLFRWAVWSTDLLVSISTILQTWRGHLYTLLPSKGWQALGLQQLGQQWLDLDSDGSSRAYIEQLVEQEEAARLEELLGCRLEFGTAGLRGLMGPGYSRMNRLTVQQTVQGLCRHLQRAEAARLQQGGVIIGYDGRHHSREFACVAAATLVSQGVPVHLFSSTVPTPFVALGVPLLGCAGGIMLTASHNPKDYNGLKVYGAEGVQIIPPTDAQIAAAIEENLELWPLPALSEVEGSPLVSDPLAQVSDHYYAALLKHLHFRPAELNATAPAMAYTALHGVGTPYVRRAFQLFGLPCPLLVEAQCDPDPDFPTVAFPNPEEGEGAWRLAFETAEQHGALLAIATDPDADRFAAAERDAGTGEWTAFTGNEIGVLLADWLLLNARERGTPPDSRGFAVLSSAVSSSMLASLAAAEGVQWRETLTGFKWLGSEALKLEQEGYTVLLAYEEAIGFAPGPLGKDKDGVAAAAAFAELAADVYARGATLREHWARLQQKYGTFTYRSSYFVADPPSRSAAVFERLRQRYPKSIGGRRVVGVRDLGTGLDTSQPGGKAALHWQPGDLMVTFSLEGGATLTLRASGTEPKLKYYLEARDDVALADRLQRAVAEELVQPERHGLTLPA